MNPLLHVLRLALGGLFIYAGVIKIWDFPESDWATQQFTLDVHNYQLTPWTASILIAVYLPWLEAFSGIALVARRLYHGALAAVGLMSLAFFLAISSAWYRDLDITCGCFGREVNQTNFPLHLALNAAMAVTAGILLFASRRPRPDADR